MTGKPNFVLVREEAPSPVPVPKPGFLARVVEKALAVFSHAEPPANTATGPCLVFAVDATASREPAWDAARAVTDSLVKALPGQLKVALAVHGGGRVHTFTGFTTDAAALRDRAAGVTCQAGFTRLLPILSSSLKHANIRVVVYIGDVFEENITEGRRIADAMGLRGTKLIVLHDTASADARRDAEVFWDLAKRTGGCVLPFNAAAPGKLRDVLAAVAVYAVGGTKLLRERRAALPGAVALLEHFDDRR